ncbi:MAG: hypothetical protein BGO10_05340 [Chlamydia sp. 32-24]|nr:MAG: hypothetical protein BGO10_05340 [Chlamydia sp. 32-24]
MINLVNSTLFNTNNNSFKSLSELSNYYSCALKQIKENITNFDHKFQEKHIDLIHVNYQKLETTYSNSQDNKQIISNLVNIGFEQTSIKLFLETFITCDSGLKKAYEATPEEIEQAEEFYTYNDKEQLIPLTKKEIELVKVIHKIYYVEFILKPYIIDLKRLQELENKKSLTSETPKEEKERVKFIPLKTPIEREDKQTSNVPPYLIILIDLLTLQRFLMEKYKQLVQEYIKIEKQNEVVEKDIQRSELKREIIKTETLKREITISEKVSKLKK